VLQQSLLCLVLLRLSVAGAAWLVWMYVGDCCVDQFLKDTAAAA
jgi:hypothetical protein